ncbi:MAG TPA: MFS transporter [Bacteroidales bacterium]|nr:MFS transporter [Bacteroidales bacterium]HOH22771.1 MFS transporter [Bacteroidales bacterium]HPB56985.1 MFS transporter [Bacteroidales bacterium]HPZ03295.1 MFS transporter [Bacteroidales bacterium]HQB74678.1 MFS transporter [Bacteroidales bacterium]
MTEKITKSLRESATARWIALFLLSFTMFFAYMFVDVLAPLKDLLETQRGWSSTNFGTVGGSEFFLNVFAFMLIFSGIILDKIGVRRTALLSAFLMVTGAGIKLYGISETFLPTSSLYQALDGFSLFGLIDPLPASATLACIGFAIFGVGVEMAGITVSKAIVKWFRGKELALAMGLEMAIARLGVFAVFRLSPYLANDQFITKPVAVVTSFLLIGFLSFVVYFFLDKKLDSQEHIELEKEDPFHVSDLKAIFTSKTFLIVAGLCVLYYSAIFPFQKFAPDMLSSRLEISSTDASKLFSFFPIGAMILTPLLGYFLDTKGKGASMLIIGAVLMTVCHLIFAFTPVKYFSYPVAIAAIVVLGISFSLVPAALWPSVPKLVDNKVLGSAYSVIFWIQNIGLLVVPLLIGATLDASNPNVGKNITAVKTQLDTIKTIITEDYHQSLDSINSTLVKYEDQFETKEFNYKHKDNVLVAYYSNRLNDSMSDQFSELNLVYRNSEKRADMVAKMQSEINTYLALNEAKIYVDRKDDEDSTSESRLVIVPMINNVNKKSVEQLNEINQRLDKISSVEGNTIYDYQKPMLIFSSFGILAFLLGIWLKIEDKKKGYGLELPNKKK